MPVDMLAAFMGSDTAVKLFGAEGAAERADPCEGVFRRRVRRTATALPVRPVKRSSRTRASWCKGNTAPIRLVAVSGDAFSAICCLQIFRIYLQ